jgi:hypothetical protein
VVATVALDGLSSKTVAAMNGLRRVVGVTLPLLLALATGCVSVDPGHDFVISEVVFDPNYFYCHVEPGLIFAFSCGSGDPSKGDPSNGCHFNSSAVSGMALLNHPAIDCGGGNIPVDLTQVGTGSPAQSNLSAVSLEMSKTYAMAPLFTRPSSFMGQPPAAHPRAIFDQSNPTVILLLSTWASK